MENTRKLAVYILEQVFVKNAYSNIVLNTKLNKSQLEDRDKALVTEIVYGTIKYKYTIDKILMTFLKNDISKMDTFVLNILRTAIYQLRFLTKVPEFAAVNEAVELSKKYKSVSASKLVNGVLRNYLRNKNNLNIKFKSNIEELGFRHSFEPWMVKLFVDQYGIEITESILDGLNRNPGITLRINSTKTEFEDAYQYLKDNGYDAEPGNVCPEAIRIIRGKSIEQNMLFKKGLATVQDESAMIVAPSMDLKKDMKVLDLCSAPGGKATHISELMNNTGEVFAFDIHEDKLSLIEDNAKRLGLTNITCKVMDASNYNSDLKNFADRVLIDVPCSGLGIIRKKPEIKWTKDMKQLKNIIKIQRDIMKNAAQYLKQDGILLYSTCTLNKKENDENIQWFLNNFKNFVQVKLNFGNAPNIVYHDYGVTILPNEYMDGFFIAKFKRIG